MTRKERKAEREFWLGCAERVMAGEGLFLCPESRHHGTTAAQERLLLFKPDELMYAWWDDRLSTDPTYKETLLGCYLPAEYRALAACFLAAMADADTGDAQ